MRTPRPAPLPVSSRGAHGCLRVHRRMVQSLPAALGHRLPVAPRLRKEQPTPRSPKSVTLHETGVTPFWRSAPVWRAICPDFPPSRHTPPVVLPRYGFPRPTPERGLARRSSIRRRISRNRLRGTGTSANWNVTYRPCRTTLARILISFSSKAVGDQCSTASGNARVRLWLKAESARTSWQRIGGESPLRSRA